MIDIHHLFAVTLYTTKFVVQPTEHKKIINFCNNSDGPYVIRCIHEILANAIQTPAEGRHSQK